MYTIEEGIEMVNRLGENYLYVLELEEKAFEEGIRYGILYGLIIGITFTLGCTVLAVKIIF
jgi:hypothetical protein